jgi:sigma-B regulation protein RsbU (phosphoserine phosphatase)
MLLPQKVTTVPGYDLEARYVPALEVSGDYYDLIPLGADRLLLVTADVSGKGIPGLVVMSMLRTALHALAHPGMQLVDTLVAASGMLRGAMKKSMFVTCHAGILDLVTGEYRYASAGHCAPVRFGAAGAEPLPAGGKPLGIFPEPVLERSLQERTTRIREGDGLLLYTDGLIEAFDARARPMGLEAVLERLRRMTRGGESTSASGATGARAAQITTDLVERVRTHCGERATSDDLTMIVLLREQSLAVARTGGRS